MNYTKTENRKHDSKIVLNMLNSSMEKTELFNINIILTFYNQNVGKHGFTDSLFFGK